jgi:hypothetical protein
MTNERIVEAGINSATTGEGRSRVECIEICLAGYAEPGYTDPKSGVIAFGNWNDVSHWVAAVRKFVQDDDAPCRVAKLLERVGVELEWSDEWTTCEHCGKAVRTKADSYSWKQYFAVINGGVQCGDCITADPTKYLACLEGQPNSCLTITVDLEQAGYVLLESGYEQGFHGGQDADPRVIAKTLKDQGVERFLFDLDSVGQFDLSFSVWIHKDEISKLDEAAFASAPNDGPSVSEGLRRSLEDASAKMALLPDVPCHPKVAKCDTSTGTATVRLVMPDEFVAGKPLDF